MDNRLFIIDGPLFITIDGQLNFYWPFHTTSQQELLYRTDIFPRGGAGLGEQSVFDMHSFNQLHKFQSIEKMLTSSNIESFPWLTVIDVLWPIWSITFWTSSSVYILICFGICDAVCHIGSMKIVSLFYPIFELFLILFSAVTSVNNSVNNVHRKTNQVSPITLSLLFF